MSINDIELASYVFHLPIFAQIMASLEHIDTKAENTVAKGRALWESSGSTMTVGSLLHEALWISQQIQTHVSMLCFSGIYNNETDESS